MTLYEFRRLLRKFYLQEKYDLIQADNELKLKTTWVEKIHNNDANTIKQNVKLDISFKLAGMPKTAIIVPIEAITIDFQVVNTAKPASSPGTVLHFETIPLQASLSFGGNLNSDRIVDLKNILLACKDVELTCTDVSANPAVTTVVPDLDFAKLFITCQLLKNKPAQLVANCYLKDIKFKTTAEARKTKTLIAKLIAASKLTAQAESNSASNITDIITDFNAFINLSANILYEIEIGYYARNQQTLADVCETKGYKKTVRDFTLGYKNK